MIIEIIIGIVAVIVGLMDISAAHRKWELDDTPYVYAFGSAIIGLGAFLAVGAILFHWAAISGI